MRTVDALYHFLIIETLTRIADGETNLGDPGTHTDGLVRFARIFLSTARGTKMQEFCASEHELELYYRSQAGEYGTAHRVSESSIDDWLEGLGAIL